MEREMSAQYQRTDQYQSASQTAGGPGRRENNFAEEQDASHVDVHAEITEFRVLEIKREKADKDISAPSPC